ncbi:dTDP-glucose 4,6-dehydratase [Candidatus Peribacteria bacterium]|nr:MAG: dTDP-glucose 4,6-dehydratase [Candidatus Peribacteria bacterium]
MNILVTGGAGFIGSHYVLRHVRQHPEDQVIVLDALTYAADRSLLDPVANAIVFVEGDIADLPLLEKLVSDYEIDTIVNFAAETHVDRSIQNAVPFLHSNVLGVQSLIELLKKHPSILLVHISTDEVYGDLQDDEPIFTRASTLKPSSPYAATKASGDLLLLAAARTYGISVRITRCTNNYGPHQDRSKLLPVIIGRAFMDQKIPIYGEGKQKRDWLYVTDHTDAIELVLEKGENGQVYLIGASNERQNIDVAKTVLKALGKPESLIQFVPDRPGHDWRYSLDASSVRALGWEPQVSFADGVRETIAWYELKMENDEDSDDAEESDDSEDLL